MNIQLTGLSSGSARARALLVAAIRYVLVRPALKRWLLRMVSVTPGLLMAIKRFGVRAGLADMMGPAHRALNGRASSLGSQGHLSVRAMHIYDELRRAMAAKGD
jgi:hypothetical protein